MNVSSINNYDKASCGVFQGKPIYKDSVKYMPIEMRRKLISSEGFKSLTKNHDVVIRTEIGDAGLYDPDYSCGTTLYKIILSVLKENSLLDKIKDTLHLLPRYSLTNFSYPEDSMLRRIDDEHFARLQKKINK